jgi:REP element-mobilizing transposase RayT
MEQLEFEKVNGWGGKRRGAGRPNLTGQVSHGKRARVDFKKPLHLTVGIQKKTLNLRISSVFKQLQTSCNAAKPFGLHVLHFALLSDHIHLIVEAKNNQALERGMKSLTIRMGKFLRKIAGRPILRGRFHLHVLKSPTEMKNALKYVLLNFSKHEKLLEHLDHFSSGRTFSGWRDLLPVNSLLKMQNVRFTIPPESLGLSPPISWLASVGWRRA